MSRSDSDQRSPGGELDKELDTLVEYIARRYHAGSGSPVVRWDELPDPERRVFLSRARQTLVAIHDAGYRVARAPGDDPATAPAAVAQDEDALRLRIAEAEHFLHRGEPLLAYNEVQQGLESWPENVRLRQLHGLALARSGAMRRANLVLRSLRDEGSNDGETMGPLARTHKDLALSSDDPVERLEHLSAAFGIYLDAYREAREHGRAADAYYTGINAASMALLLDRPEARRIAAEVRQLCERELARGISGDAVYWVRASLAEAALVLGELPVARSAYADAAIAAGQRFGDIATTRKQANLLLDHLGKDSDWLADVLAPPPVLIFTGHMIDAPGRESPRFPMELEDTVTEAIRSRIESTPPLAAYGSAACGTDIICLETVQELGGETHIILPFPPEVFREVSVDFAPGGRWGCRFDRVVEAADSVTVASEHRASGSASSFEYANLILTGMGRLRAQVLGAEVVGLAVWDGLPGDCGGTASVVELWKQRGFHCQQVDPGELWERPPPRNTGTRPEQDQADNFGGFSHEIKAMMFADAVGYSRLSEDQIPIFVSRFLGSVARLNEGGLRPIHTETAGDGLYVVFPSVGDAGHYAISLSELVHEVDWEREGLPADMDIRIGLHCGPVFCGRDPINGLPMYTGPHTSRTARIEPITPPGQVYASGAFAAVAAAVGVTDLDFRYVGRTQLAKKYGALPLFHVRRGRRDVPA